MPSSSYIIAAIVVAMLITFATRAIPFPLQTRLQNSKFLLSFGRWMPVGTMIILLTYSLTTIPWATGYSSVAPYVAGFIATSALHFWRGNTFASIIAGTFVCVLLSFYLN
ncbi:putative branched-chain amino acid permease [Corynebacterium mustelae]|uniref:Putative branched-chain amino acid permease n=1 Tax=Corynebacterium mustelae TaxID=571915 RepID=A0A0G3GZN5_9CORY|nr:AzlD domain-containing protein [Corynebacterium mustelae]AKK06000.1 putative branched-chain amino acid permease [Corynebacterium mustelae]